MTNLSFQNNFTSIAYDIIATMISFALLLISIKVSSLSFEFIILPSTSIAEAGMTITNGGEWIITLCDHAVRILLIAIPFSIFSSIAITIIKLSSNNTTSIIAQIICATAFVICMGWQLMTTENGYPTIDIIFTILFFSFSCIYSIKSNYDTSKIIALSCILGVVIASIGCALILYITLLIAMFAHIISVYLDLWTYIDFTLGSEYHTLHVILAVISHIQNILFFSVAFFLGIGACYLIIKILVRVRLTARFLQSAVSLWSLEFLLYAITDKTSMEVAMFDTLDFCIIIVLIALLTLTTILGGIDSLVDD